jgi:hypothetical protein
VIGLLRYTLSDTFQAQRWVAPVLSLGAIDAIISAQTGSLLPTFAILATALLFVATWLTVVVVNNEDPIQLSITETCAGSRSTVRLSKLLFSYLMAAILGFLAMVPPVFVASTGTTVKVLVAGFCGILLAALTGVSLGALCSRPVVRRRAWSVLVGFVVCLGTVLVPSGVPSRQLLVLFNKTGQFALALPLMVIAFETLALCSLAVVASLKLSIKRS